MLRKTIIIYRCKLVIEIFRQSARSNAIQNLTHMNYLGLYLLFPSNRVSPVVWWPPILIRVKLYLLYSQLFLPLQSQRLGWISVLLLNFVRDMKMSLYLLIIFKTSFKATVINTSSCHLFQVNALISTYVDQVFIFGCLPRFVLVKESHDLYSFVWFRLGYLYSEL